MEVLSRKWTGNDLPKTSALNLIERFRPSLPTSKEPLEEDHSQKSRLEEYAEIARLTGFNHDHIGSNLAVESFKDFLRKKDWGVFDLKTVCAYMDEKASKESLAKSGWHWRPLREKDNIKDVQFGTPAYDDGMGHRRSASDHYWGPHVGISRDVFGRITSETGQVPASSLPYDKLVPVHALKKVLTVEREYGKPVSFFVCDYAPAPHIEYPDPFLMAVINNDQLNKGVGRFVIDFWDEPGFGLEQQLK